MLKLFRTLPVFRRLRNASDLRTGYGWNPGKPLVASTWGEWLDCQPSPRFKPNHRLYRLSHYIYGSLDYTMSVTQCEKWGYGLNVDYSQALLGIADSQLSNPQTDRGRLIRLAATQPDKYPVVAAIRQRYPDATLAPDGHLTYEDNSKGGWSPEASPAAMQIAEDYKLEPVRALAARGVSFATIYDGGEEGIPIPGGENPDGTYGRDAAVVAAKGGRSWVDYLSDKSTQMLQRFRDAVRIVAPNRQAYVYYPSGANPYANVPSASAYILQYNYVANRAGDLPSSSVYYHDLFTRTSGMGNPKKIDRAYYDQLTHQVAAVAEQITYNQPHSYNFVSAGWRWKDAASKASDPDEFLGIRSYEGFLKCMYALGQLGGIAGYFTPDASDTVIGGINYYPTYDPTNPPQWLLQMIALGRVHALFSWVDDLILDGDLLPGIGPQRVKSSLPSYEYQARIKKRGHFVADETIRCFARKHKTDERWLVVLWVAERLDGSDGSEATVVIEGIPSLPALTLKARPQGSIYVVSQIGGRLSIHQVDSPKPNPQDTPIFISAGIGAQKVSLSFYAPRSLDPDRPPLASAFTVSGGSVSGVKVLPFTIGHNVVELSLASELAAGATTIAYNGQGLVDCEGNVAAPFSVVKTIFA